MGLVAAETVVCAPGLDSAVGRIKEYEADLVFFD